MLAVLPQRLGPITATAERSPRRRRRVRALAEEQFSVATSWPSTRPRMSRPGWGPGTTSGARSRPRARRAPVSTPRRRRRSVPGPGPATSRWTTTAAATTTTATVPVQAQ
jgi:hypothetical protein